MCVCVLLVFVGFCMCLCVRGGVGEWGVFALIDHLSRAWPSVGFSVCLTVCISRKPCDLERIG